MTAHQPVPAAVLASGRGSNLEAILRHQHAGYFDRFRVACVLSDIPGARALDVARDAGIPAFAIDRRVYETRDDYENELLRIFTHHHAHLVVLAGYMRIVGPILLAAYPNRIVNIHPSLLPSFPGLHAQRQALEYGVRYSGCTVHFVDEAVDTGPIIGQRIVPVHHDDTEDSLTQRILDQEHQLFSQCLKQITEQSFALQGRWVTFTED